MNKKLLGFLLLLVVLFLGTMNYTNTLQKPINELFNSVKTTYTDTLTYIQESIERHFFQAQTIQRLEKELDKCKQNTLLLTQFKNDLDDLYRLNNTSLATDPNVQLVRAISYEKFGDMNRVWLDIKDYNASKIYGLVFKEAVAGIVIEKNGMPLGILNRDPKSSYAVTIGKAGAPGIAHGNNEQNIVVTFIPTWYNIHIGDEVTTSGLDNIFFKGLKVGVIQDITTSQGYQKAVVKPYYNLDTLNYFYMITKVK